MPSISVNLRNVPGTQAAIGWAGGHTLVVDRPEGRAGGMGLGFNGGQILALAIAGCLCNDLRYVADQMGMAISALEVEAIVHLEGQPLLVIGAELRVKVTPEDPQADVGELLQRASTDSTVSNSVTRGFPVTLRRA